MSQPVISNTKVNVLKLTNPQQTYEVFQLLVNNQLCSTAILYALKILNKKFKNHLSVKNIQNTNNIEISIVQRYWFQNIFSNPITDFNILFAFLEKIIYNHKKFKDNIFLELNGNIITISFISNEKMKTIKNIKRF